MTATYPAYGPSNWARALIPYEPCMDGFIWASRQPDYDAAWANCNRGDWMLYWIGKLSGAAGSTARQRLCLLLTDIMGMFMRIPNIPSLQLSAASIAAVTSVDDWADSGATTLADVRLLLPVDTVRARRMSRAYQDVDVNAAAAVCALCAYCDDASIADYIAFSFVKLFEGAHGWIATPNNLKNLSLQDLQNTLSMEIRSFYPTPPALV